MIFYWFGRFAKGDVPTGPGRCDSRRPARPIRPSPRAAPQGLGPAVDTAASLGEQGQVRVVDLEAERAQAGVELVDAERMHRDAGRRAGLDHLAVLARGARIRIDRIHWWVRSIP